MDPLYRWMVRHARTLCLLTFALTAIPAAVLPYIRIDNSMEVWLPRDAAGRARYAEYLEFRKTFGTDMFVVLAAEVPDPASDESLQMQEQLARDLAKVPGVDRVLSTPELLRMLGIDGAAAAQHPLLKNLTLGPDGRTFGVIAWTKPPESPEASRETVAGIEALAAGLERKGIPTHLAGGPLLNAAFDRASARDAMLFLPLAIGACILALALMSRTWLGVAAPMAAVAVSATTTVGLMVWTGHAMNAVTVIMPTLHFVLGLSNGIRLCHTFKHQCGRRFTRDDAMLATLQELTPPLFFMTITMVIGFIALLSSNLPPVAELGLFSAIGLVVAFLSNLLVVPGMLLFFTPKILKGAGRTLQLPAPNHWTGTIAAACARRPLPVVAAGLCMLFVCALAMTRLHTEANVLQFFPERSKVVQDYKFIGEKLSGFYTIEVHVRGAEELGYDIQAGLKKLEKRIAGRPGVVRIDYITKLNDAMKSRKPGAPKPPPGAIAEAISHFYREDDGVLSYRFCVLINSLASADFFPLVELIEKESRTVFPEKAAVFVTGTVTLLNAAQAALVETQIKSFAESFTIIIIMVMLLYRSLRSALVSVLPNLLPIAAMFATMAATGIALDAATVMIASVAMGIAVDNCIYVLCRYRSPELRGKIREVYCETGGPIVSTSLIAAAGFCILVFASFRPIEHFGILTGLTLIFGMAAVLTLLPAGLALSYRLPAEPPAPPSPPGGN